MSLSFGLGKVIGRAHGRFYTSTQIHLKTSCASEDFKAKSTENIVWFYFSHSPHSKMFSKKISPG